MLQALHVHNFALIEDAEVEFVRGFNIFTGETGAGKSILIDAFGIVLGGRASAGLVRTGTDAFWVQAVFDPEDDPRIAELLQEQGIEPDDSLFLKRRVTAAGKSQSSINGVQVPLAVLKSFSELLVDIHGQHENQALLQPQAPRLLVDAYGGEPSRRGMETYQKAYEQYRQARSFLSGLEGRAGRREQLMDRLEWEIREISEAQIRPGEEEALRAEAKLLQNSGKIMQSLSNAYAMLDEDGGALDKLAAIREKIGTALRYDPRLQAIYEETDSAWIAADDAKGRLQEYLDERPYDTARMEEVQTRLDLLYRLQKKYGAGEETVLAYLATARTQYEELQDLEARIEEAKKKVASCTAVLTKAAEELTRVRKLAAEELTAGVAEHIRDLAMADGQFKIAFTEKEDFAEDGKDWLQFLFSANLGEPLKPLAQVASGGELSRLALAVRTVLLGMTGIDTMVFDEIDTGVGGVTAQKMAEKMCLIARRGQVLCITHLPQIAVFADRHIRIEKQTAGGRTSTCLTVLGPSGRIEEIVRMTAGDRVTEAARRNAEDALAAAEAFKRTASGGKKRKRSGKEDAYCD